MNLSFPLCRETEAEQALRKDVRSFLSAKRAAGSFEPAADCWISGVSFSFSKEMAARGWLGMTWPKKYGGHERPLTHRHIVAEEMVAAGAPVAAHWIADRQSGSQLLRFGSEAQKAEILPRIAAGECYFSIGMSEPDAGSDLASIRTHARYENGKWTLSGRKIWSTGAHFSQYMIVLARTGSRSDRDHGRHQAFSQFLVDLSLPGIDIRGIGDISGAVHFNETIFDDVVLGPDALIGNEGDGWKQVMGELSIERSGPERYLTTLPLLELACQGLARNAAVTERQKMVVGSLLARLRTLQKTSFSVAQNIESGFASQVEAVIVKERGGEFENDLHTELRSLLADASDQANPQLLRMMWDVQTHLPSNTLRGGTTEILRGIIARELGLR